MNCAGQIVPGSKFGNLLTHLASEAETIVETGTWFGGGSTRCLHLGMVRPSQRLYTVEIDQEKSQAAAREYSDERIIFLAGTIVLPEEFQPFEHPHEDSLNFYKPERDTNALAPYVLSELPKQIGLLLIDASEWTGDVEFDKLWDRSAVIALDDTNPATVRKNVRNRQRLLDSGWEVIADDLNDRHGYFVAKRP